MGHRVHTMPDTCTTKQVALAWTGRGNACRLTTMENLLARYQLDPTTLQARLRSTIKLIHLCKSS